MISLKWVGTDLYAEPTRLLFFTVTFINFTKLSIRTRRWRLNLPFKLRGCWCLDSWFSSFCALWPSDWRQELSALPAVDLCTQEVIVLLVLDQWNLAISGWIQEVPSSRDLWIHSKSPLTPGSVSPLRMDLWSPRYWPSEAGSAHSPWSGAVHSDPVAPGSVLFYLD